MPAPLLATKLYIPPAGPQAVARPRLIERLTAGVLRPGGMGLVSAPAGFGKSSLLSAWVCGLNAAPGADGAAPHAAWLSLDAGDNELGLWLRYVIAALQTLTPGLGAGALNALDAPQPPPAERLLPELVNDLAAHPGPLVLVLDDAHVLEAESVLAALAYLVEHGPPHVHLVVATREDPPLPLARLRVRGRLIELREIDLRFTFDEAATFLTERMGLPLSAAEVAALEARTEGWIAGLHLAALSLQGEADRAGFIRSFTGSHHFVMDYLLEEVLARQPAEIQAFLLATSVLGRMCAPLCAALLERPADDGQRLLEALERAQLLLIPLDAERQWFRYHHLFADMLRARLAREGPDRVRRLHARAGAWFAEHGLMTEAIPHALAGADYDHAADWLEQTLRTLRVGASETVWLAWVAALPEATLRIRPVLCTNYALTLVGRDPHTAEALFDHAEWLFAHPDAPRVVADPLELRSAPGVIAIGRAYRAGAQGAEEAVIAHAHEALARLPADDLFWRGAAAALLGIALWARGELDEAFRFVAQGTASLHRASGLSASLSGTHLMADIRLTQGRLREAEHLIQHGLAQVAAAGGLPPPATADLHVLQSELCFERNDLAGAADHLARGEALGESASVRESRFRWFTAQAALHQARGDLTRAQALLDEARLKQVDGPVAVARPIAALKARVWLAQGQVDQALGELGGWLPAADDVPTYAREFEWLTAGRILLARQAWAPLADLLARVEATAQAGARMRSLLEVYVIRALAHQARGELAEAAAALRPALALAQPEGFIRPFVAEGPALLGALKRLPTEPYARQLVLAVEGAAPATLPGLLEPLTEREIEIVRLLALGLSNQQISERLYLALSTVKSYNQRLFAKLHVQRRTEAIARARELGLV
jgi:LuxR family maltose regulon positive regulatory protein